MEPDDRPWWEPDPNRELPRVTIPQWGLSPSFWSAVPVFIRQVLAAPNAARTLVGCVLLEGKPVQRVELCGVLVEVVSRANYTVLQLDDGTGTLRLLMTVNEDELMYGPATDPDIQELRRTVRLGSTIKAIGRLNEHKGEREVLVDFISRVSGPLEEARWWEMAVRAQGGVDGGLGFQEIDVHRPLQPLPAPPPPPPAPQDPEAVWKIADPEWAERYAKQRAAPPERPGPVAAAAPKSWMGQQAAPRPQASASNSVAASFPQGPSGMSLPQTFFPAAAAAHAAAGSGGRGLGDGSGTGRPSWPGGAFQPAGPVRPAAPAPRLNPEAERALAAVAAAAADYDSLFSRPQAAARGPEQPSTSAAGPARPPAQAAQPPNYARNPTQNFSMYQQGNPRPGSTLASSAQRPLAHSTTAVPLQGPGSGLPDLGPGPGPAHGHPSGSFRPGPGPAGLPPRDSDGARGAAGPTWPWGQPPVPRQPIAPAEEASEERGEQGSDPARAPHRAATGAPGSLRSFHPVAPTWEQQPPKRPRQTG